MDYVLNVAVFVMKKRTVFNGIINHCCQRAAGLEVLFYSLSDFLVFYTIVSVMVRKFMVKLVSLCLMYDHFHMSVITRNAKQLSKFMFACTWTYAKEMNPVCHRKGDLFQHSFKSSVKRGDKKARSNIIYLANNPVERKMVKKAEEYRWNFLAYYLSDHPFSKPLVIRDSSWPMRKAIQEVKSHYAAGRYLNYTVLKRISSPLNRMEQEQLTDFIISTYKTVDYEYAIRFFDSYEDMITAIHADTGSEYDLNEIFIGKSDEYYPRLVNLTLKQTGLKDIHDVLGLPEKERYDLFDYLILKTEADPRQIAAFLRIKVTFNPKDREMEVAGNEAVTQN